MAYTLHWSNYTANLSRDQQRASKSDVLINTSLDYREKLGTLTPALSLTADVLFPNALSAVSGSNSSDRLNESTRFCKGNQLDESYPLQIKLPTCVPLVQFNTSSMKSDLNPNSKRHFREPDMCAKPVLNWESYIRSLKEPQRNSNANSILKNDSALRIKNICNVLYNYHGACDWTYDSTLSCKDGRMLLVGKGENLRAVRLKRPHTSSVFSYSATEIFDELPKHFQDQNANTETLDRLIFQIVAHRRESIAAVRRGTTIDLYNTKNNPVYLSSIPAHGYSAAGYRKHWVVPKKDKQTSTNFKPKFLSFDLDVSNPCQIATLDDNRVIQIHDIVAQSSSPGVVPNVDNDVKLQPTAPSLTMDHAAGLLYAHDPNALYYYDRSQIYFYDKREHMTIMGVAQSPQFHSLLNLRSEKCVHAISDQRYFTFSKENKTNMLNEHVTCVQRSSNTNYYYVGTTHRIFLMDWRVPSHPVLKMSHGMLSPASYIDTKHNKSYEVIVAGSQRGSEIFSAVIDYAHVRCESRSECSAKNPILQSYPRHLSNPKDFIDAINNDGFHFAWENEQSEIENRYNAWCTGLSICDLPMNSVHCKSNKPPGNIVISTNNHGDIFYQEWLQKPVEHSHLRNRDDYLWTKFVEEWKCSVELQLAGENLKPKPSQSSKLPEDCSLAVEPSAELMKKVKVKESSFNNLECNLLQYDLATRTASTVQGSVTSLIDFKGSRVNSFLNIWENDWECQENVVNLSDPERGYENPNDGDDETLNMNLEEFDSRCAANTSEQPKTLAKQEDKSTLDETVEIKQEVEETEDAQHSDVDMFDPWLS